MHVLTNKRKYIEQNFHSIAGVIPRGWDLGVLGGSKTLAWEFAMAPHRLRILVVNIFLPIIFSICFFCAQKNRLIETVLLSTQKICFR